MSKNKRRIRFMNYESLCEAVRDVSKEYLKKIVFELDQQNSNQLKEMNLDDETKRKLLFMFKARSFFEMLIINGLKQSDE